MALCPMKPLLEDAARQSRAVGAFSCGNMEMVLGAVKAAEDAATPIILQIAEARLRHSPLHVMGPLMVAAAKAARVDVAVHFDHGATTAAIRQALDLGFTSVMFDGSHLAYAQNEAQTAAVQKLAAGYGATCEAELGVVGGTEDGGARAMRTTNPGDVAGFVASTGADALAVAIGNAHGEYASAPCLRFDVLADIHSRCPVPLVLHGGSGITDVDFRRCIALGVRKINIATAGFGALVRAAQEYFASGERHSYFGMNDAMVEGVYNTVRHHIRVFGNAGPLPAGAAV